MEMRMTESCGYRSGGRGWREQAMTHAVSTNAERKRDRFNVSEFYSFRCGSYETPARRVVNLSTTGDTEDTEVQTCSYGVLTAVSFPPCLRCPPWWSA